MELLSLGAEGEGGAWTRAACGVRRVRVLILPLKRRRVRRLESGTEPLVHEGHGCATVAMVRVGYVNSYYAVDSGNLNGGCCFGRTENESNE